MQKFGSIEMYMNSLACKLYRFFPPTLTLISQWIVVYITGEVFTAICFPFYLTKIYNNRNSAIALCSITLIAIISQIWRFFIDTKEVSNLSIGIRY